MTDSTKEGLLVAVLVALLFTGGWLMGRAQNRDRIYELEAQIEEVRVLWDTTNAYYLFGDPPV